MPLKKVRQRTNMYDWVTHMWNCIIGECPHKCSYCYVKKNRFIQNNPIYKGEQRFNPKDENIKLGTGKVIFVAHTNDLFTADQSIVIKVLKKCIEHPGNQYIFQTKDPMSAVDKYAMFLPNDSFLGATIETDIDHSGISVAPCPVNRLAGIREAKKKYGLKTFITIEPVMRFSSSFAEFISTSNPDWVNIGADSKHSHLPEPTKQELEIFISELNRFGVLIKKKSNLERLLTTKPQVAEREGV